MIRLSSSSLMLLIFILCTNLVTPTISRKKLRSPDASGRTALFIFGDSYVDSGNNNYINTTTLDQANFSPYGESYFKYPTGRFSNGRLVSDFIAEYAKLPLIPPFLQPGIHEYTNGVNFASAGAGSLTETFRGSVIDLKTRLSFFRKVEKVFKEKLGNFEAGKRLSESVYLFSIGTNDYMSLFLTNSTMLDEYRNETYVGIVIGNLTSVIEEIHARGGRKFGFINVPDIGCLPGIRIMESDNGSCLKEASMLAKLHNKALLDMLNLLETRLAGFKYWLFDFNSHLQNRINRPFRYGLNEEKKACCGSGRYRGIFSCGGKRPGMATFELCENPNEYVFWDSFHLTEEAYKQLADQMWYGTVDSLTFESNSLKNLFL